MTAPTEQDERITVHAFFLADFAAVESGKAYVSGGFWDRMAVPEFPSTTFFSIVAVIKVPWGAYHSVHSFSISMQDAEGNEQPARFDGEFQVSSAPHMRFGDPTIMPLSAVVNGMPFDGPGDFSFILQIDGEEISRWPLRVTLAEAADAAPVPESYEPPAAPPVEPPPPAFA